MASKKRARTADSSGSNEKSVSATTSSALSAEQLSVLEFVAKIGQCGWFDGHPPSAKDMYTKKVAAAVAAGRPPWAGMVILDQDDHDEARTLKDTVDLYVAASAGVLAVTEVTTNPDEDELEEDNDTPIEISFKCAGRRYSDMHVRACGSEANIKGLVNSALADKGSPLRFIALDYDNDGMIFPEVLASEAALSRAAEQGLCPEPWAYSS